MATRRGLHAVLDSLASGTSALYADSAEQMTTALRMLMDRAVESGEANVDIDALDLLRAVAGVSQGGAGDDWVVNAKKVVAVLVAGIRTRAATSPSKNKMRTARARKRT